ncbi:MAG: glycosyltransferase, exosortase A system-associated [Gammaproteobacteria bacterium]|nr:glycosyltransferase, exosortase A system-associated [Gammaproteobacteria bacterium]MBQ0840787.1 glycosyltransferase, exosortase A system-associated [Gammaproteobacteria bacterium]
MKILHILDHSIPLHSGYTFRTRAILEQQRAMAWKTYHLTSAKHQGASSDIEEVDGFEFYRTRAKAGFLSRLPFLNQLAIVHSLEKRIDEVIKEVNPDVLHAHSPALNGIAAVRAGRRNKIPVVYECRAFWEDAAVDHGTSNEGGLRYRLTKALETYVFRHADAVTTICEGLRKDIISRGISANKVTVIPNAVDIERFTFAVDADTELREELGLAGKKVLGFIGSFYAYEGLPLLLDAMPKMLQHSPDIRLLLVGGGPQEALIKEKVSALKLEDVVVFTGRVPHDQVQAYYNQVDIFVYPRLAMRLTELVTPLKPLEAMAQGRLVVASDVGGHKELIRDKQNGCLFKAGDADDLARSVLDLLSSESAWPALKKAGRDYVETERNWQVSVANYQSVYPPLVSGS